MYPLPHGSPGTFPLLVLLLVPVSDISTAVTSLLFTVISKDREESYYQATPMSMRVAGKVTWVEGATPASQVTFA